MPSISNGQLNHAAFKHKEVSGEMILPVMTQRWRIGADVVHEITHALQSPCPASTCTDEQVFDMEMQAHINERQHLTEMVVAAPETKYADDAFNYLVAASLPNVEWADQVQKPLQRGLCEDVILNYRLDQNKITENTKLKYNCSLVLSSQSAITKEKL